MSEIHIIKPGVPGPRPDTIIKGICEQCGCEFEAPGRLWKFECFGLGCFWWMKCPQEGCKNPSVSSLSEILGVSRDKGTASGSA